MQQQQWQQQQLTQQGIQLCLMQLLPRQRLAAAAERYHKSRKTKETC
jgi:BarA-like signal transduction histidine kinase